VISGRQLHGQEALTNQFMYYAQSTALSRAVHGVPIPVRCTMSQSPCGARCANPRAVHGVPIPVRLLTVLAHVSVRAGTRLRRSARSRRSAPRMRGRIPPGCWANRRHVSNATAVLRPLRDSQARWCDGAMVPLLLVHVPYVSFPHLIFSTLRAYLSANRSDWN
jgi:hypothetical protein